MGPLNREEYTILAQGLFREPQVLVHYDPDGLNRTLSPALALRIEEQWRQAELRARTLGRDLFNSPLFRLAEIRTGSHSSLSLGLGDTDYREYLESRAHPHETPRADPLGTAVIVFTTDGLVPVGKRSQRVEVNPGRYFTFGGFFDRGLDWRAGGNEPSLFGCARRELEEELGIQVPEQDLRLLGIIYDQRHPHPEACFLAPAGKTGVELLASRDAEEISDLLLVPLAGLASFLEEEQSRICESLRGGFEIFLRLLERGAPFGDGPAWAPLVETLS
ncbi:MAG TPA: NUDIX domain-containing protein [Thermoanaerobaculia bacterium]|nr:NUDIX domain-containing protein [Thermoanaerobaculia bacterium]